ncbi:MAG: CPBP family intramembrane metalloprotease [Kineosporiaceae bacterium]|nr:CPBP family intramembrane metalloprotease [Aeromicrobium sp.]
MLGVSLSTPPGSRRFYVLSLSTAVTWTAGSSLSGPLRWGWIQHRDEQLRRPVVVPVATGLGAFAVFYAGALVSRRIPVLRRATSRVLLFADEGDTSLVMLTTVANGVAEELFFRGALYQAFGRRHPVLSSTGAYTLATVATRNPALVLAAGATGALFALQRRASGGIQASTLTHLTWSMLMVRFLPPLFRDDPADSTPTSRRLGTNLR